MSGNKLKFGDIKKFYVFDGGRVNIIKGIPCLETEIIGVVIEEYKNRIVISGFKNNNEKIHGLSLVRDNLQYTRVKLSPSKRKELANIAEKHRKNKDDQELRLYEFGDFINSKLLPSVGVNLFKNGYVLDTGYLDFDFYPNKKAFVLSGNIETGIIVNANMDFIGVRDNILKGLYIKNEDTQDYKKVLEKSKNKALIIKETKNEDFKVANIFELNLSNFDEKGEIEFLLKHRIVFQFKDFSLKIKNARMVAEYINDALSEKERI